MKMKIIMLLIISMFIACGGEVASDGNKKSNSGNKTTNTNNGSTNNADTPSNPGTFTPPTSGLDNPKV